LRNLNVPRITEKQENPRNRPRFPPTEINKLIFKARPIARQ
jgi:hypothetical protein